MDFLGIYYFEKIIILFSNARGEKYYSALTDLLAQLDSF